MRRTRTRSLAVAALAGCNTQPPGNASLDEARNEYRMASEDQQTRDLAGTELQQAKDALGQAIRLSIGATRAQLIRQLMIESLLLGLAAGVEFGERIVGGVARQGCRDDQARRFLVTGNVL